MSWECYCEKGAFSAVWSGWKALRIVVSSKIPFDVGMEGIVLLELENVFVLLLRDNRVRRAEKLILYGDWLQYDNPYSFPNTISVSKSKYSDCRVCYRKRTIGYNSLETRALIPLPPLPTTR